MANDEAVTIKGLDDARMAASMPKPSVPEGYEDRKFEDPQLSGTLVTLRRMDNGMGNGMEFGPFAPEGWYTDPETGVATNHDESGRVFALRVLTRVVNGNLSILQCVDENGMQISYIVNEIADNTLEDPEIPAPGPSNREDSFS